MGRSSRIDATRASDVSSTTSVDETRSIATRRGANSTCDDTLLSRFYRLTAEIALGHHGRRLTRSATAQCSQRTSATTQHNRSRTKERARVDREEVSLSAAVLSFVFPHRREEQRRRRRLLGRTSHTCGVWGVVLHKSSSDWSRRNGKIRGRTRAYAKKGTRYFVSRSRKLCVQRNSTDREDSDGAQHGSGPVWASHTTTQGEGKKRNEPPWSFLKRVSAENSKRRGGSRGKEGRRGEKGESRMKGGWTTMDDDHGRRPW